MDLRTCGKIDGELLGGFLSFIYPILGAEEVITPETPMSAEKKKAPAEAYTL